MGKSALQRGIDNMAFWRKKITDSSEYKYYLIGGYDKRSPLRDGNLALDYLAHNYSSGYRQKERGLVYDLPMYGDLLYRLATREAAFLSKIWNEAVDEAILYKLSLSMFDFILTIYFDEVFKFLDSNKEASSLLTDALLFQVTGQEGSTAKEDDIHYRNSHNIRGIQKFLLIKQMKVSQSINPPGDTTTWLLGVEAGCILGGQILAVMVVVGGHSLLLGYDAKATMRLLLYNEKPDMAKRIRLEEDYAKDLRNLTKKIR
jgi:hypothetical protein